MKSPIKENARLFGHRKILRQSALMFAFSAAITTAVLYFHLTWWQVWILISVIGTGFLLRSGQFTLKKALKNSAQVLFFILTLKALYRFGWWGALGAFVFICVYVGVTRWKQYLSWKWEIERMLFGKPLKDFAAAGEKPPKFKIKW